MQNKKVKVGVKVSKEKKVKILNNLNIRINKTPNKKENINFCHKKNNSMSVDTYSKQKYDNSKYNKKTNYKSNNKNKCYDRIIAFIPNSKFPLSSKKQLSKKNNNSTLTRKHFIRGKKCNHSTLNIRGNSREYY